MIVNNSQAVARLDSPMNLINKLRQRDTRNNAMNLFGIGIKKEEPKEIKSSFNPFQSSSNKDTVLIPATLPSSNPPESLTTLDNILKDHDAQIKLGLAHDKALELLSRSVDLLTEKLDDVSAAKLPSVISAAAKTVEGIRKERNEASKNNKDREVHYHFYTPKQKTIEQYEVIDVAGL